MKKIGILTIIDYTNYGNRLQNYATQEILSQLNYKAETILNHPKNLSIVGKFKSCGIEIPKLISKKIISKIQNKKIPSETIKMKKTKTQRFKNFTKEHIKESNYSIYTDDISKFNHKNYHKVISGSDQIWNPNFRDSRNYNDFLGFAPKDKRIAFSPSFGISNLTKIQSKKYKKWLNEMSFLSCREKVGADLIYNLTGRNAEVLVDPTMVLSEKKWSEFASPQEGKTKKKYLLTYFLGSLSDENQQQLNKIALQNQLEIINLCNEEYPEIFIADPTEWVDYIKHADFFCTDSFHGVVFSILMKTPFAVFNRGGKVASMSSRIDTILSKFKLEERRAENVLKSKEYFNVNFDHCEEILEKERKKAIFYLKNALEN